MRSCSVLCSSGVMTCRGFLRHRSRRIAIAAPLEVLLDAIVDVGCGIRLRGADAFEPNRSLVRVPVCRGSKRPAYARSLIGSWPPPCQSPVTFQTS